MSGSSRRKTSAGLPACHERPDDARHLVGQRHRDKHSRLAGQHPGAPGVVRFAATNRRTDDSHGADDQVHIRLDGAFQARTQPAPPFLSTTLGQRWTGRSERTAPSSVPLRGSSVHGIRRLSVSNTTASEKSPVQLTALSPPSVFSRTVLLQLIIAIDFHVLAPFSFTALLLQSPNCTWRFALLTGFPAGTRPSNPLRPLRLFAVPRLV